ncbi:MAG: hypothetical protein KKF27_20720 [Gammaproteobacteria bacterium]|nr:hypothetical protein [Gammaproteobacteria bacterium]
MSDSNGLNSTVGRRFTFIDELTRGLKQFDEIRVKGKWYTVEDVSENHLNVFAVDSDGVEHKFSIDDVDAVSEQSNEV